MLAGDAAADQAHTWLLDTTPSPRDYGESRMPASAWKKKDDILLNIFLVVISNVRYVVVSKN